MKKVVFLIAIVLAALVGVGQDTTFHLTIGTPGIEDAVDLFETNEGVLLFGNTGNTGNGQSDIYIVNVSFDLTLLNSQRIGTVGIEKLTSVTKLNNGNYVLASYSYDGFGSSDYDIRLDVADSSGVVFNTLILEELGVQTPVDLCSNEESIFLLFRNEGAALEETYFVRNFDYQLNEIQSFGISLADSFALNAIDVQNNSIWVAGEIVPQDSVSSDVLILKLSLSGSILSVNNYGGRKSDYASSILIDSDSRFWLRAQLHLLIWQILIRIF